MKIRAGFVSNSSSSSFVLKNKNISLNDFLEDFIFICGQEFNNNPDNIKYVNPDCYKFITVNKKSKKEIIQMYKDQCWSPYHKINYEYNNPYRIFRNFNNFKLDLFCRWISNLGKKTYLQEAMEANIFGVSDENEVPYEVLEKLKEKYGKYLTIRHLG